MSELTLFGLPMSRNEAGVWTLTIGRRLCVIRQEDTNCWLGDWNDPDAGGDVFGAIRRLGQRTRGVSAEEVARTVESRLGLLLEQEAAAQSNAEKALTWFLASKTSEVTP